MSQYESKQTDNDKKFKLQFDSWEINMNTNLDSFYINIKNCDSNIIYENNFQIEFFQNLNSFESYYNINNVIYLIKSMIEQKLIFIKEEDDNLNLTFIFENQTEEIKLNKKKEKNKINLHNVYTIPHQLSITSISVFPSGNFISVSENKSIYIYNSQFEKIKEINNGHQYGIYYVNVKDENNFVTASFKNIITWIKNENEFKINEIIENAHTDWIYKVLYYQNGSIISCSNDKKIKIWEENNNNKHECITILLNEDRIRSILLLSEKNILVSSGYEGTKLWNLNNFECFCNIKDAICCGSDGLNILNNDNIIVGGDYHSIISIISIKSKNIIKSINNVFGCLGICVLDNGIFLIGGMSNNIKVYKNYECIQEINQSHRNWIFGFVQLKNNVIASYSQDGTIKIWSFD